MFAMTGTYARTLRSVREPKPVICVSLPICAEPALTELALLWQIARAVNTVQMFRHRNAKDELVNTLRV